MGPNFVVPARSWADIAKLTAVIRAKFGQSDVPQFPVMTVLEHVLDQQLGWFRLDVGTYREMNGAEGLTDPAGEFIMLREDVYEKAWGEDGRGRFTAAHELGHYIMHTNVPMARAKPENDVPPYRLSEQQANQFAAELLMPKRFFRDDDDETSVAERFGVSREAAGNRIKYLRGKGKL